ncbi:transmembrane sensor/regulator PpyR [Pseudomonas sp. TNT2022 ID1044]|uniref:transmembrane sensor/regulator PpyR n=1 Tax=Pseudomonas sp. TNT2022 ID1044 TaxID=2942636 RepID=UPI00235F36D1|nr:transmembrane sensor/regulator PpyR [Pseudomonas sp. TNT2022 ID1044]MDD0996933.1 transmembrane sensor/regulator PpyR [Pseudomonas sp. TNT2022 ID1044]
MYGFFEDPYRVLKLSCVLLIGGLFALIIGAVLAYGYDAYLSLPGLVMAHALTILGPTAIKLGYVMRLLSFNRLRRNPVTTQQGFTG